MTTATAQTHKFVGKREALIASASGLINEYGIRGTTLSQVAEGVGLVKNSVTYYFRHKEDLAAACYQRSIDLYRGLVEQASKHTGLHDRLGALLQLHAQMLQAVQEGRHPPLARFQDLRGLDGVHRQTLFAAYSDMFRQLRALLHTGSALPRNICNAQTHIVLAVINAQRMWLMRHEPERFPFVAQHMHILLTQGLMAPQAEWQAQGVEMHWQLGHEDDSPAAAFLRTATQLINEQGYHGASVNRISERLQMTKGGFYYHNDTKDDLVSCCFSHTFHIIRQALALAEAAPLSGWERIGAVLRALVLFQLKPGGSPLLQWSAVPVLPDEQERTRILIAERFSSLLVGGMMDGSIRPLDPMQAAQLMMVGISAVAEHRDFMPQVTFQDVVQCYVRPLLVGLQEQQ